MSVRSISDSRAPSAQAGWSGLAQRLVCGVVLLFVRLITGLRASGYPQRAPGCRRVYIANHRSHGDFALVWAALPEEERAVLRPVAGRDYWQRGAIRRFIARTVFNALLIERRPRERRDDPVPAMAAALERGHCLLVFPEGTRNDTDMPLLGFRNGIARFAQRCPEVEFVPVWIENLNRVLPKGEVLPVPLLCRAAFGQPLTIAEGESRAAFRDRLQGALLALSDGPAEEGQGVS